MKRPPRGGPTKCAGARLTKIRPPGWGIFEFYRELSERARWTAPEALISLKAPLGISHVQGLSGWQYTVQDGIVAVVEEDAPPLLRAGFSRV